MGKTAACTALNLSAYSYLTSKNATQHDVIMTCKTGLVIIVFVGPLIRELYTVAESGRMQDIRNINHYVHMIFCQ